MESIKACPVCDSADVYPRSARGPSPCDDDYHCTTCGSTFNDAVERERKRPDMKHATSGLAAKLERMDP